VPPTACATAEDQTQSSIPVSIRRRAFRERKRGGSRSGPHQKTFKKAVNLSAAGRDQKQAPQSDGAFTGTSSKMETIRPENTDPIPLRTSPHRMGTIMIRFVGLLVAAIVVLALIWSR
jgi:hypothetical protein